MRRGRTVILLFCALIALIGPGAADDFKFKTYAMELYVEPNGNVHEVITATIWNWGSDPIHMVPFPLGFEARNFEVRDAMQPLDWKLVREAGVWVAAINLTTPIEPTERRTLSLEFDMEANKGGPVKRVNSTYTYSMRLKPHRPIEDFRLRVRLPPGYVLPASLDRAGQGTSLMYPEGSVETDGRTLIMAWTRRNLDPQTTLEFSVAFEKPVIRGSCPPAVDTGYTVQTLLVIFMFGFTIGYVVKRFFMAPRTETMEGNIFELFPSLSEEEGDVVRAIARAGNTMMQSDLTRELDYSKSKISRTITALESRNIIRKEHIGKVNRIILNMEK
ncbi:MAG: hypothetical protein QGG50_08020 [Methanopyri archaeon]|jgi:hypothetical protein|nr:hypothetical protein [Methanopyri archaeon]